MKTTEPDAKIADEDRCADYEDLYPDDYYPDYCEYDPNAPAVSAGRR